MCIAYLIKSLKQINTSMYDAYATGQRKKKSQLGLTEDIVL